MSVGTDYSEPSYHNIAHNADALEKNVEEYPFSSLTRYLLLCQYCETGHGDFEKVLKKTALYFNNRHWLQFQLSQIGAGKTENAFVNEGGFKIKSHENQSQNHFAVVTDEQLNMYQNSGDIFLEEEKFIPGTQSLGSHIENYYEKEPLYNDETDPENVPRHGEEFIPDSQTLGTHVQNMPKTEAQPGYENVTTEIIFENEIRIPHTQALGTYLENIPGTELQHNYGNDPDEILHRKELPVPETQSLGSHDENIPEQEKTGPGLQTIKRNDQNSGQVDSFDNKPGEVVSADQLTEIENSDTMEPIAFEPLHTVDYFASQGIRITDEALTNDKLGTQMKSFTEWLKGMKKLHVPKLPEQNSLAEDIIQSAAEVSNIDTEVLTEAMAEVLIKQDKKDKAIEMYNKLSLINPSKSAYFAAKIESIKSN